MRLLGATLVIGLAWLAAVAGAVAQPMTLKTGGWEMTYETRVEMPGLPPEFAKLPPEQRAKMEKALRESWKPRTLNAKTCLTKADLAELAKGPDDDGDCKYTHVEAGASRWEADMVCGEGRTGHTVLTAPSSDRVTGNTVMRVPTSGGEGETIMKFAGRWVSASCEGFDD